MLHLFQKFDVKCIYIEIHMEISTSFVWQWVTYDIGCIKNTYQRLILPNTAQQSKDGHYPSRILVIARHYGLQKKCWIASVDIYKLRIMFTFMLENNEWLTTNASAVALLNVIKSKFYRTIFFELKT